MKPKTLDDHLFSPGPKRILSLDGGGVRGIVSLGYLKAIEDIVRKRFGPTTRLCDYFDLVGGTSTGAVMAGALALGFEVSQLQELYRTLAAEVFKKSAWRVGLLGAKFPKEPLVRALQSHFGDLTLGSRELKTGLVVVAKRLDTNSPWILHNNPKGLFFNCPDGDTTMVPNSKFILREIIRASTAAPHYFEPECMEVAPGLEGAFVDGGMSPFNNPALQMLMVATLSGFGFNWPMGRDNILLTSVGTGFRELTISSQQVQGMTAAMLALRSLASLMEDCNWLTQTMLQWMSDSPTAWEIDSEVKDLKKDKLGGQQWLSYLRYNVELEQTWLDQKLGIKVDDFQARSLYEMDHPENVNLLNQIGTRAAQVQIKDDHFPASFDLTA